MATIEYFVETSSSCLCFIKSVTVPRLSILDPYKFVFFKNISIYYTWPCFLLFLKSQLNICRHDFTKFKYTVTNLITSWFRCFLDCSQPQVDTVYFYLSNAFDLVPCALFLNICTDYELSIGWVSWSHCSLTNRPFSNVDFGPSTRKIQHIM